MSGGRSLTAMLEAPTLATGRAHGGAEGAAPAPGAAAVGTGGLAVPPADDDSFLDDDFALPPPALGLELDADAGHAGHAPAVEAAATQAAVPEAPEAIPTMVACGGWHKQPVL